MQSLDKERQDLLLNQLNYGLPGTKGKQDSGALDGCRLNMKHLIEREKRLGVSLHLDLDLEPLRK